MLDAFHERELARLKGFSAVSPDIASIVGLSYCRRNHISPPEWLARLAETRLVNSLNPGPRPVGRATSPIGSFEQNYIHYVRWDTVDEIREQQVVVREQLKDLRKRKMPRDPKQMQKRLESIREREAMFALIGRTWFDAYAAASDLLRGTPAAGGEHTMKRSYNHVQTISKDPDKAKAFYLADWQMFRELGLDHLIWPDQVLSLPSDEQEE